MLTSHVARERAHEGATLLDAKYPGWAEYVPAADLMMHNPCYCILGHVYGGFVDGLKALFSELRPYSAATARWAYDHGFDKEPSFGYVVSNREEWDNLETAWINEIAIRVMAPLA